MVSSSMPSKQKSPQAPWTHCNSSSWSKAISPWALERASLGSIHPLQSMSRRSSRQKKKIPWKDICGQLGGLFVDFTFIDPSRYFNGNLTTLTFLWLFCGVIRLCEVYFVLQNRRKEARRLANPVAWARDKLKSYKEMETEHPDFVYKM